MTEQTPSEQLQEEQKTVETPLGEEPPMESGERFNTKFSPIDRRSSGQTGLFSDSEKIFASTLPKSTHWSIAWSDLMMTMFILFLSMFVYQATHKDFLVTDELGVLGGNTADALEIETDSGATFPFVPIKPGMPLATGGIVKKAVPTPIDEIDIDSPFIEETPEETLARVKESFENQFAQPEPEVAEQEEDQIRLDEQTQLVIVPPAPEEAEQQSILQPRSLVATGNRQDEVANQQIQEIFTTSKANLSVNNLENFASVELVPDRTVRIILTSDLLFGIGSAELSNRAISSLEKIADTIRETPYVINVVGHTDNTPMFSGRFASNWELSVTRASSVARFLIDNMGMNPNQFVVSGYSSFRPLKPNNNINNRAANRRVEIIISKRLPEPVLPES